jgi:hypothetical protein
LKLHKTLTNNEMGQYTLHFTEVQKKYNQHVGACTPKRLFSFAAQYREVKPKKGVWRLS